MDNSSSAGRSMSSGAAASLPLSRRKGGNGGEALAMARPDRLPTRFAGARFLPATGLPVHAVRPSTWPAPLVLPPVLGARGGTGLRGLGSLDC